eukprot:4096223-Amphidinium_carterae.1
MRLLQYVCLLFTIVFAHVLGAREIAKLRRERCNLNRMLCEDSSIHEGALKAKGLRKGGGPWCPRPSAATPAVVPCQQTYVRRANEYQ